MSEELSIYKHLAPPGQSSYAIALHFQVESANYN